jgi:predicted RNA binding protein YcfA (HicA-like mRNA interferase family)
MSDIPSYTPSKIIGILQQNGFEIIRIKGSHHILLNRNTNKRVVVPMHKKTLPKGTQHEIFRQSGLDINKIK